MPKLIAFLSVLTTLFSCFDKDSYIKSRLETSEKFINCLRTNKPDKILDFTYNELNTNISDKEMRDDYVNKAYKLIRKFGLPSQKKWIVKYNRQDKFKRLIISVPLFKGYVFVQIPG
ncbi:MAG: hypothetical protein EOO43_24360, partial [Flavobacterium sp.]